VLEQRLFPEIVPLGDLNTMGSRLRFVITILGIGFALQGLGWIVDPARAAAGLGMPLLDGIGRSTQAGDFASFFLTLGGCMVVGARPRRSALLYVAAALLGGAAVSRTLVWAFQDAAFAGLFIAVEVGVAALLLVAAAREGD
jgi:hypothetical protein